MNNPNNLTLQERGITPTIHANKGINFQMSKKRRAAKHARYKANEPLRLQRSRGKKSNNTN